MASTVLIYGFSVGGAMRLGSLGVSLRPAIKTAFGEANSEDGLSTSAITCSKQIGLMVL